MAKYSFTVSGSQLIVSLVPVLEDVQPTSMSYLAPSFKIGVGKINAYEYGQPKQSFLFTEIGEIDGVEPTDLQDAFDKLTTATANFNGGGAAPYKVYTALLSQSGTDAPVATVLENTLGFTPIYTYSSVGVYTLSPLEDFSNFLNKGVVIFLNKGSNDSTNASNSISCAYNYDDGALEIRTYANGLASDDILSDVDNFQKTSFEIRVYN